VPGAVCSLSGLIITRFGRQPPSEPGRSGNDFGSKAAAEGLLAALSRLRVSCVRTRTHAPFSDLAARQPIRSSRVASCHFEEGTWLPENRGSPTLCRSDIPADHCRNSESRHHRSAPFRLSDPTPFFELSREYHCAFGPIVSASEGMADPSSGNGIIGLFTLRARNSDAFAHARAPRIVYLRPHAARGLPVVGAGSALTARHSSISAMESQRVPHRCPP